MQDLSGKGIGAYCNYMGVTRKDSAKGEEHEAIGGIRSIKGAGYYHQTMGANALSIVPKGSIT